MSELIQDRAPSAGVAAPGAGPAPGSIPPPGGTAAQAPGRRGPSRFLLFALAAIAGLVVGGVVLFLRSGSAEEAVAVPAAPAGGSAAASSAGAAAGESEPAEAAPAAEEAAAAPARTTRLSSRDPFAPLFATKAEGSAAEAEPAPASPSGQAPAAPAPPAPTPATGATISALSISPLGNSVSLKLDGKKYEVDEGEMFAENYRLYDIFNDSCAGFLYGDQNAIVCEGDKVTIG